VGGIEINREEYKIVKDDIEIALKRIWIVLSTSFKPGKVFKRDEILDKVWGNEVVVGGRTIDPHKKTSWKNRRRSLQNYQGSRL
jgi:two-component system alkaline phosphatase synthesis response regulator PhoP